MEQRRFVIFVLLSTLFLFGWLKFGPILLPNAFPKQGNAPNQQQDAVADQGADEQQPAPPAGNDVDPPADQGQPQAVAEGAAPDEKPDERPALPDFPNDDNVVLGSIDSKSEYFLELHLSTRGAALRRALLNDDRFVIADVEVAREVAQKLNDAMGAGVVDPRTFQVAVVGSDPTSKLWTLASEVPHIDAQLQAHGKSLRTVDWEVVQRDQSSVTFRYPAPDGSCEVRKTFQLNKGNPADRDGDHVGYLVDVSIELINHTQAPLKLDYALQGPVGLPLENAENTRTFVEIKVGTAEDPGSPVQYLASTLVKQEQKAAEQKDPSLIDAWRDPLAYVGVDVQYFAALLLPQDPQTEDLDGDGRPDPTFAVVKPERVGAVHPTYPERTDLSLKLESRAVEVPAGGTEKDEFKLFLGPKRPELLDPLQAGGIITFGWFSFVAVGMVYALNFFHHALLLPYGLAIVLLTLIVRACMFPITRKQAAGAKKMKDLQPKLQELKAKYSKEPEKFWQAQRELFRKHNYSPLSGCLPLILQLPIFIGLYSALSFDVDLRMAPFLWIDNLAAPDELFSFGTELPLVHWTHFNLLPLITICLWVVQQKMFMPPPTTEEQALQYKVMNYMMIVIGFMIYRVPAGLCVYFITSTLWGISERKLIDYLKIDEKKTDPAEPIETTAAPGPSPPESPRAPGWLAKLVAAADEAKRQGSGRPNETAGTSTTPSRKDQRNGKKKRPNR